MCPLELVATPMPSPRYKFGGSLRKSDADSKAISGTSRAFALALSCAWVRPSAGVCAGGWANWGMAQASAAHTRQVLVDISLLWVFASIHPQDMATGTMGRMVRCVEVTAEGPGRVLPGPSAER